MKKKLILIIAIIFLIIFSFEFFIKQEMYLHIPDNTDKINVIVRNHTLLPSNRPKHQFLTYTNEKEIAEFENLFKELQSSEKDHSLGFTTSKIICYKNNYEIQRFTFYTFNF